MSRIEIHGLFEKMLVESLVFSVVLINVKMLLWKHYGSKVLLKAPVFCLFLSKMNVHQDHVRTVQHNFAQTQSQRILLPYPKLHLLSLTQTDWKLFHYFWSLIPMSCTWKHFLHGLRRFGWCISNCRSCLFLFSKCLRCSTIARCSTNARCKFFLLLFLNLLDIASSICSTILVAIEKKHTWTKSVRIAIFIFVVLGTYPKPFLRGNKMGLSFDLMVGGAAQNGWVVVLICRRVWRCESSPWRLSVTATTVTAVLLDWTLWCTQLRIQSFRLEHSGRISHQRHHQLSATPFAPHHW